MTSKKPTATKPSAAKPVAVTSATNVPVSLPPSIPRTLTEDFASLHNAIAMAQELQSTLASRLYAVTLPMLPSTAPTPVRFGAQAPIQQDMQLALTEIENLIADMNALNTALVAF